MLDERDSNKRTPLHIAVEQADVTIVCKLLKAGAACIDVKDSRGLTPLHEAVLAKNLNIVREFLKYQINLDALDRDGRTPLHKAVEVENVTIVSELINAGAHIDDRDSQGLTPLHEAVIKGNLEITRFLLRAGANPKNSYFPTSRSIDCYLKYKKITCLDSAIKGQSLDVIKELVKAGADVESKSYNWSSDLPIATSSITTSIPSYLNKVPQLKNDIFAAVKSGAVADVKKLIDQGAPVVGTDEQGNSPLHYAIGEYKPNLAQATNGDKIARLLVQESGKRGANPSNSDWQAPLHGAVLNDNLRMINLLLRNGADVNAQDLGGNTPSHYVLSVGAAKLLLNKRADLSVANTSGQTAFDSRLSVWGLCFARAQKFS